MLLGAMCPLSVSERVPFFDHFMGGADVEELGYVHKIGVGVGMSGQKSQHSQSRNIVLAKKAARFGFLTSFQKSVCLSNLDCPTAL